MKNGADIKYLFKPRSIAVIGASHKPEKIGYLVMDNIVKGGYKGKIYPINPGGGELLGCRVRKSLGDVPGGVDIAVIIIPGDSVFGAVKECAEKRVKHLVVITSGFSEVGNFEGEKQVIEFARANGMRVLGPNIFGIYSAAVRLNATFGPSGIKEGGVAIVTQSGAIGVAMIGKTKAENIGLSSIISVGNKADIDERDLLAYLSGDPLTKIILIYMEGVKGGEGFVDVLSRTAKAKPVVVIKSGRSKRGAMAAASHTGSLAGADSVFDEVVRQCGVMRAESIEEALRWCKFLSSVKVPKGENTVIITNGGGIGVLAADACEKYGVPLYDDAAALKDAFEKTMPAFGSSRNPIDMTGQAGAAEYNAALSAALKDARIDSVICLGCETAVFQAEVLAKVVRDANREYSSKKPICFSMFGGAETEECVRTLRTENIPIYEDVYVAASNMGALYSYYRNKTCVQGAMPEIRFDKKAVQEVIAAVKGKGRAFLLAEEARRVMDAVQVSMPKSRVARGLDDAVRFAEEIGFPVVLKVVSKDIIHKSDAGGVALGLDNREEVMDAFESILHNCRRYRKDAVIEGVEVSEMVKKGVETIVGGRRDPSFGPVVMFGLGGIYVEVMKDVAFRAFPFGRPEAFRMISDIKSYPLLLGVRGEEQKDIDTIADYILKIGTVVRECPEISDIEINPLVAYEKGEGAVAVDVRILISV